MSRRVKRNSIITRAAGYRAVVTKTVNRIISRAGIDFNRVAVVADGVVARARVNGGFVTGSTVENRIG